MVILGLALLPTPIHEGTCLYSTEVGTLHSLTCDCITTAYCTGTGTCPKGGSTTNTTQSTLLTFPWHTSRFWHEFSLSTHEEMYVKQFQRESRWEDGQWQHCPLTSAWTVWLNGNPISISSFPMTKIYRVQVNIQINTVHISGPLVKVWNWCCKDNFHAFF